MYVLGKKKSTAFIKFFERIRDPNRLKTTSLQEQLKQDVCFGEEDQHFSFLCSVWTYMKWLLMLGSGRHRLCLRKFLTGSGKMEENSRAPPECLFTGAENVKLFSLRWVTPNLRKSNVSIMLAHQFLTGVCNLSDFLELSLTLQSKLFFVLEDGSVLLSPVC